MLLSPSVSVAAPPQARPAPPVVVRVEGLTKRFAVRRSWKEMLRHPGRRQMQTAVDGMTFEARAGEILGLLGPNGAGKSTMLKMLATLVTPDAGCASVAGHDVVREPARVRRLLAPVSADERSLDWRLSARENLRFFGTLQGLQGGELTRRIDEVLAAVELQDTGKKLVGEFSSGMKQRLLIARALLSRPRVLLLDEPTRSLDPLAARDFRAFLRREIAGEQGCTVLLATHDPEEALEMSDRLAILNRGRLLALGTSAELSRTFGEERYRIWTSTPDHSGILMLSGLSLPVRLQRHREEDGWTVVDLHFPPGGIEAAQALSQMVAAGARISRFEKVQLTLPDLLDRVISQSTSRAHA